MAGVDLYLDPSALSLRRPARGCSTPCHRRTHRESPWTSRRLLPLETRMRVCPRIVIGKQAHQWQILLEGEAAGAHTVRALRTGLGIELGTLSRVARRLGYSVESARSWVRRADIGDGYTPGVSSAESQRIRELEQGNRELKRAHEILKRAAIFFGAKFNRQHKK